MPVQHDESASAPAVKKLGRQIRYDAVAAVIAALVGMLALVVAGYTAYIQRQQVRAQVWPYLMWANSDNGIDYLWINKGVGPAIIKNAVVLVDGKPQRDWNAVMHSMQVDPQGFNQSTFNHNVISAGETLEWIKFKDHDHFLAFRDAARKHLAFKVCYCSTLGDCWLNDSTRSDGNTRFEVRKCPAIPAAQQFDD